MEEHKYLSKRLIDLKGNPYRADGQLKTISTLSREIKTRESMQTGGYGCSSEKSQYEKKNGSQMGGEYKKLPQPALKKASDWRAEAVGTSGKVLGLAEDSLSRNAGAERRSPADARL